MADFHILQAPSKDPPWKRIPFALFRTILYKHIHTYMYFVDVVVVVVVVVKVVVVVVVVVEVVVVVNNQF